MIGVSLGVDVGNVRIGVVRCDALRTLATPLETVARDAEGNSDIARLLELIAEYQAVDVVVGLPLNLRGEKTASTAAAESFAAELAGELARDGRDVTVRLVDERLSTVTAQQQLQATGKNSKKSRGVIDQAAAVVILQHALDSDSVRGELTGQMILPESLDEH